MRKPLIHNLLHDKDLLVQVVDIKYLILNQNMGLVILLYTIESKESTAGT
jgi:hypothetical protein